MGPFDSGDLIVLGAALVAGFASILARRRDRSARGHDEASANHEVAQAATLLVAPLNERIAERDAEIVALRLRVDEIETRAARADERHDATETVLRERIEALEAELTKARAAVGQLAAQVRALGATPVVGDG